VQPDKSTAKRNPLYLKINMLSSANQLAYREFIPNGTPPAFNAAPKNQANSHVKAQ
jgi:hypothetical protein